MGLFGSILGAVGGLISGNSAKKATRKAQAAQIDFQNRALAEQQRQFDVTRGDFAPYLAAGTGGLKSLGDLIGVNGADAQSAGLVNIQNSPELAAMIRNGEEAVLQNASATGGLRGGNIQSGLANFRADAFANQLQTQIARLAGLAGLGQGATDSVSAFGANKANNVGNIYGQMGDITASNILARGGINSQIWNNAGAGFGSVLDGIFGNKANKASLSLIANNPSIF